MSATRSLLLGLCLATTVAPLSAQTACSDEQGCCATSTCCDESLCPDEPSRFTARLSGGVTDDGDAGASGELVYRACGRRGALCLEAGLGVGGLQPRGGGRPPCPPGGECPDELRLPWDFIVTPLVGLHIPVSGRVSLRPTVAAGLALQGASDTDAGTGIRLESRTAPAVAYGLALDYAVTSQISVFGQYRGFSIFTGEREFTGPNGSFTGDVGTENRSLFSTGIGLGF